MTGGRIEVGDPPKVVFDHAEISLGRGEHVRLVGPKSLDSQRICTASPHGASSVDDVDRAWVEGLHAIAIVVAFGVALVAVAGALVTLWFGSLAAQAPDPFAPSGDPCCGQPDSWGEVATACAWTIASALAIGVIAALAAALVSWGMCWQVRVRQLMWIPAGTVLTATALLAVALIPLLDDGVTAPDCDTFAFDRVAWQSETSWRTPALGASRCGLLDGRTPSQVRRLLGAPTQSHERDDTWSYRGLTVVFIDGRARQTRVQEVWDEPS